MIVVECLQVELVGEYQQPDHECMPKPGQRTLELEAVGFHEGSDHSVDPAPIWRDLHHLEKAVEVEQQGPSIEMFILSSQCEESYCSWHPYQ